MARARGLPATIWVGPHLKVSVVMASQATMHEAMGDEEDASPLDGCWMAADPPNGCVGTIYIDTAIRKLDERWSVLRHELMHALHDISDWHTKGILQ